MVLVIANAEPMALGDAYNDETLCSGFVSSGDSVRGICVGVPCVTRFAQCLRRFHGVPKACLVQQMECGAGSLADEMAQGRGVSWGEHGHLLKVEALKQRST